MWRRDTGIITFSKRCGLCCAKKENGLGLTGLVSYAVTNHPFTQKPRITSAHTRAEWRWGCGRARSINMPAPLTQRMSFVIYFDYLSPATHVVHVAAPHQEMISRIYQQYGISHELCGNRAQGGDRGYCPEHEPEVQTGTIRVRRAGADTAATLRQACENSATAAAQRPLP